MPIAQQSSWLQSTLPFPPSSLALITPRYVHSPAFRPHRQSFFGRNASNLAQRQPQHFSARVQCPLAALKTRADKALLLPTSIPRPPSNACIESILFRHPLIQSTLQLFFALFYSFCFCISFSPTLAPSPFPSFYSRAVSFKKGKNKRRTVTTSLFRILILSSHLPMYGPRSPLAIVLSADTKGTYSQHILLYFTVSMQY